MITRNNVVGRRSRWIAVLTVLLTAVPLARGEIVRLGDDVFPTFQAIELTVDPDKTDYTGSVRIDLDVRKKTNTFRFHAQEMTLNTSVLERKGAPIQLRHTAGDNDMIIVTTASPLAPGGYALKIDFSNDFNTRGLSLYRVVVDGRGYVYTQFEAIDARGAFPCWDEPAFKIPFQVTMTVPKAHMVISNTPVESEKDLGASRKVVFARTKPLPAYLLAMAVGPFETVEIPGMSVPGRVVTVKGKSRLAAEAVRTTPPILKALEKYFGKYPYRKLDLLAVPEFAFGAMENVGAVTYRDTILLIDPDATSDAQRAGLAGTTAHELAHMWFGNLVTLAWWDDTWLNESFATWMGTKIADEVFPEYKIEARQTRSAQRAMITDARLSTRAIRRHVEKPTMVESVDEQA